jgi:hypothetical protein
LLIRKASTLNADRSRAMLRRADAMKSTPRTTITVEAG